MRSAGDCNDVPKIWNLSGCRSHKRPEAVSELPAAIVSPRPDGAIACECQTEGVTSRNVRQFARQTRDLDRIRVRAKISTAAVWSQLSIEVYAPRPDRSVFFKGEAELLARGNARNV